MSCDCDCNPYHRWNCRQTPIWAQTMRDLDCNPWTLWRGELEDADWVKWNWHTIILCPGCGEDKDVGIHGSYSPYGGCV